MPTLVMNSRMGYVTLEIPKSVQYTLSIVNNKHNNSKNDDFIHEFHYQITRIAALDEMSPLLHVKTMLGHSAK
jgi:hypothetical protein